MSIEIPPIKDRDELIEVLKALGKAACGNLSLATIFFLGVLAGALSREATDRELLAAAECLIPAANRPTKKDAT